jgi:hypothetical protein
MHPLAWVAIILLGLFGIGLLGIFGFGLWVARNPALAVRKLLAANPNMEVLSTDDGAGTITVRDRRNGKVVTLSFDQVRNGRFRISADDGDGRTAEFQVGGEVHLPSWLPSYPGSVPRGVFSARGDSGDESGDAGSVTFTTADSGDKVLSFYEDKARALDMEVRITARSGRSGTLAATDDEHHRGFKVIVVDRGGESHVTLTFGRKI